MSDWKITRVSQMAEILSGGTPKTEVEEYWNGNIPWLSVKDFAGDTRKVYASEKHISELGLNNSATQLLHPGDIIISARGTVGEVAQIGKTAAFNQSCYGLRATDGYSSDYLYYMLKYQVRYLKSVANGAVFDTIVVKTFDRMKASVPDLPTQARIADILSAYDDLIEDNNRRITLLEKVAQELYKEWFVRFRFPGYETAKFENGLPEGWMVMRVKDLVKRYPFGTLYKGDSILSEGKTIVIDQSTNEYAGFHNNEPSHIANIDRPIILFGDHTCKYQLMTIPFSLSENVVPFTGAEAVETTYLYYLVNGIVETTEYKRHWTEFVSKKVLVADNKVQRLFREKIKDSLLLIESLKLQNRNLTKQRDLLLPRLMSGKLEV